MSLPVTEIDKLLSLIKNILNIAVIKIYGLITINFTALFLTGNQHFTFKYCQLILQRLPYHTVIFIYYAIKFIEAQGVKIQDPYHLKEALANKDMRFAEYIEKTSNHF